MFFFTYLRRELRRRMRQAVFIALGLALGIGLVITVSAAAAGAKNAQASVLHSLYGVGTDITVTKKPPQPSAIGPGGGTSIRIGPAGSTVCTAGKCNTGSGQTLDDLSSAGLGTLNASSVTAISKLHGVAAAGGGLVLNDNQLTIPASVASGQGGNLPLPKSFSVNGVDLSHGRLGPLSNGKISAGRTFSSTDASADVAVVDSNYATANKLKAGSVITIAKTRFKVIGIVSQPQSGSPANVYIPLGVAQKLGTSEGKSLRGMVNTIYVAAASAADIGAVQAEISKLLPAATVTSSSSLASEVTGSLANTANLANNLGKWLAIAVLIAAFAVASLLTMAAVSRRVREFGTLKALGWRSRRIIGQVMGESVVVGIIGGIAGVGAGFGGAALISAIAPTQYATVGQTTGSAAPAGVQSAGGPGGGPSIRRLVPDAVHSVPVHLSASVTVGMLTAAVLLAVAGGLLAGSFGGWRAARLRPAAALAKVG
jgi:putative ABC transport system permease protein